MNIYHSYKPSSTYFYSIPPQIRSFSLPIDTINFLLKNIKSRKLYQKLVKTCKYFYSKNPIIHFYGLVSDYPTSPESTENPLTRYRAWHVGGFTIIDLETITYKIWLSYCLRISQKLDLNLLFKKIFRMEINELTISNMTMAYKDFYYLASKNVIEKFECEKITIKTEDGKTIEMDKILKLLPEIKEFRYRFNNNDPGLSSATIDRMIELPYFDKLKKFHFDNTSEGTEIEKFFSFMKKNKQAKFDISFYSKTLSPEYVSRLQNFVENVAKKQVEHDLKILIYFDEINSQTYDDLLELYHRPPDELLEAAAEAQILPVINLINQQLFNLKNVLSPLILRVYLFFQKLF